MNVRDTDEYIKNMLGLPRAEAPVSNPDTATNTIVEPPISASLNINNHADINQNTIESKEISVPKIEKLEEEKKNDENPNVYTQTKNIDFININNLNNEESIVNNSVKSALNDLNIVDKSSTVFSDNTLSVEDKDVPKMQNNQNLEISTPEISISAEKSPVDNLTKMRLATAIRLAKDTVEDIKTAGYSVTMEEVDAESDYQIIIKVQK